jgi:hypothetical protein
MDRLCYRSTMRKCINGRSGVNFSLIEFPAIREISKKRSLLISVRTINTTVIQPLFAINRRDVVFVQKIIQPCNITVEPIKLVTVTNTLHVSIVLEAMQRTTRNVTNGKSYCKNNTDIIQPIFAYERIQKDVQ